MLHIVNMRIINWVKKTEKLKKNRCTFICDSKLFNIMRIVEKYHLNINNARLYSAYTNEEEWLVKKALNQLVYLEYIKIIDETPIITDRGNKCLQIFAKNICA